MLIFNKKTILLHRFLIGVTNPTIFVDHIDSDVLNNKKNNLRFSNKYKNPQSKSKVKNSTSKYLGIYLCKIQNKWIGTILKDVTTIYSHYDKDEIIAARRRDMFILNNL